jgi:molybdate transport system ATP-binding protein
VTLAVDIMHRLGGFRLAAEFASAGRLTVLFGRSGSGKTSIVNIVAGLVRPQRGRIVVDGQILVDTQDGIFLPPHRRRIGYVFQEARLFPHLTVRQNLGYGRWFTPARERYADFDHIVDLLGIEALLERRPAALSGGEKQRVAIGRALLASPQLLLMDEPLASLDEARKAEILPYIEKLRDESRVPILYVSHSVAEVSRLATTVVVMSEGKVVSVGRPGEVLYDPAMFPTLGRHEAGAVIDASVIEHHHADQLTTLGISGGILLVPMIDARPGTRLRVHLRARDITLSLRRLEDVSALNILPVAVVKVGRSDTAIVDVQLRCGDDLLLARITRRSRDLMEIRSGQTIFAMLKSISIGRRDIGVSADSSD